MENHINTRKSALDQKSSQSIPDPNLSQNSGTSKTSENWTSWSPNSSAKALSQPVTTSTRESGAEKEATPNNFVEGLPTSLIAMGLEEGTIPKKEALDELYRRSGKGDPYALEILSEQDPMGLPEKTILARKVRDQILAHVFSDDLMARKVADRDMDALQRSLEGPNPTPIERLLVERIVICKCDLEYSESLMADRRNLTDKQSLLLQQRISMSHARYLQAIKALAQVRKLGLPNIQVNVGQNQINIGP